MHTAVSLFFPTQPRLFCDQNGLRDLGQLEWERVGSKPI